MKPSVFRTATTVVSLVVALSTHAQIGFTNLETQPVDISTVAELDGSRTTDVVVAPPELWTEAQIIIELTRGSIYRNEFGHNQLLANPPALFPLIPALEFDTQL